MRVHFHQLYLMMPATGILEAFGKIEVQKAYRVDGIQMEVPVTASTSLLADGKSGIIDGAILEELLVDVLHLHNEFLALFVFAIYIEDGTPGVDAVAKAL